MPRIYGIHHIALTVTNLSISVPFYEKVLESSPVTTMTDGPFTRRVFALPGGQRLGLTQHDNQGGASFDPTVPGLDHVGLACLNRDELVAWASHLDRLKIPHSGVQDADYGSALSLADPDGNALEFFASA